MSWTFLFALFTIAFFIYMTLIFFLKSMKKTKKTKKENHKPKYWTKW